MQRYRRITCTWDKKIYKFLTSFVYEKYKVFYEDTRFFMGIETCL